MRRASTIDRLQRLELLTARVKSGEPTTVRDLADELGVSLRTVSRDIDVLRQRGLPIDADRGRGGGVRLQRDWGVGRINLNYAEAVDLLVSLAIAEQTNSPLLMANLGSIRRKLIASFSSTMSAKVSGLKARIRIGKPVSGHLLSAHSCPHPQVIEQLHQAFLAMYPLAISYRAEDGAITRRTIQPHFLLLCSPIWYVLAWDELRSDVRTFRCDRITAAEMLSERSFQPLPMRSFEAALAGIDAI